MSNNTSIPTSPLSGTDPPPPHPPSSAIEQNSGGGERRGIEGEGIGTIQRQPMIKRQTTEGEDILYSPSPLPPHPQSPSSINPTPPPPSSSTFPPPYNPPTQYQGQNHNPQQPTSPPYPYNNPLGLNSTSANPIPSTASEFSSTVMAGTLEGRRRFSPLFTLVEDKSFGFGGGEVIHPRRICYVFEDDDPGLEFGDALVRCSLNHAKDLEGGREMVGGEGRGSGRNSGGLDEREREREREERVIIVDLNENGDAVVGVNSLSEKWQVLGAEVGMAPIWEGDLERGGGEEGGLMLRIEGVGVEGLDGGDGVGLGLGLGRSGGRDSGRERESAVMGEEEMQSLLEGFDRKMAVLRRVVGVGAGVGGGGGEGVGEGGRKSEVES